jgi:hypothetical protein
MPTFMPAGAFTRCVATIPQTVDDMTAGGMPSCGRAGANQAAALNAMLDQLSLADVAV